MMQEIKVDNSQSLYGIAVGIIHLKSYIPCILGDVDNARTFRFPVHYEEIAQLDMQRFLYFRDQNMLDAIMEACNRLLRYGVKAITSDCGYFVYFQRSIVEKCSVPVYTSSLCQLPFILNGLPLRKQVLIIVADADLISPEAFIEVGLSSEQINRLIIVGLQDKPYFRNGILREGGHIVPEAIQLEVNDLALEYIERFNSIGTILLECSNLPPYAFRLQKLTNLPIYDYNTLINFVYSTIAASYFPQEI